MCGIYVGLTILLPYHVELKTKLMLGQCSQTGNWKYIFQATR